MQHFKVLLILVVIGLLPMMVQGGSHPPGDEHTWGGEADNQPTLKAPTVTDIEISQTELQPLNSSPISPKGDDFGYNEPDLYQPTDSPPKRFVYGIAWIIDLACGMGVFYVLL